MNPKLSAYMQLWGNFDFNKTPLAPAGCKTITHERANERGTWAKHGERGYFVSPTMYHYRNYRLYIPKTHSECVSNSVQFFPKHPIPKISSTDRIVETVKTLTTLAKNPHVLEPFPDNSGALTAAIDAFQKIINSPTRNQSGPIYHAQSQRVTDTPATQRVKPRRSQRVQQQTVTQPQAGTQRV